MLGIFPLRKRVMPPPRVASSWDIERLSKRLGARIDKMEREHAALVEQLIKRIEALESRVRASERWGDE